MLRASVCLLVLPLAACGLVAQEPLTPQVSREAIYAGYSCPQLGAEQRRIENMLQATAPAGSQNNVAVAAVIVGNQQPSGPVDAYMSGYRQGAEIKRQREADERLRERDRLIADYDTVQRVSISRGCVK